MDYLSKIENDLRIFKIFKKINNEFKQELNLLITPENILNLSEYAIDKYEFQKIIERILNTSEMDIIDHYASIPNHWSDRFIFERIIEQTRVYLQLRPILLERYPELLI